MEIVQKFLLLSTSRGGLLITPSIFFSFFLWGSVFLKPRTRADIYIYLYLYRLAEPAGVNSLPSSLNFFYCPFSLSLSLGQDARGGSSATWLLPDNLNFYRSQLRAGAGRMKPSSLSPQARWSLSTHTMSRPGSRDHLFARWIEGLNFPTESQWWLRA